jgi:hypothetical protein
VRAAKAQGPLRRRQRLNTGRRSDAGASARPWLTGHSPQTSRGTALRCRTRIVKCRSATRSAEHFRWCGVYSNGGTYAQPGSNFRRLRLLHAVAEEIRVHAIRSGGLGICRFRMGWPELDASATSAVTAPTSVRGRSNARLPTSPLGAWRLRVTPADSRTHALVAAPAAAGTTAFVLPWPGGARSRWRQHDRPDRATAAPRRACEFAQEQAPGPPARTDPLRRDTRPEMRRLGLATVFARHVARRACRMASLVAGLSSALDD